MILQNLAAQPKQKVRKERKEGREGTGGGSGAEREKERRKEKREREFWNATKNILSGCFGGGLWLRDWLRVFPL